MEDSEIARLLGSNSDPYFLTLDYPVVSRTYLELLRKQLLQCASELEGLEARDATYKLAEIEATRTRILLALQANLDATFGHSRVFATIAKFKESEEFVLRALVKFQESSEISQSDWDTFRIALKKSLS